MSSLKMLAACVSLVAMTAAAHAAGPASESLVNEYIQASKAEQTMEAQVDATIGEYTAGAAPEMKKTVEQYVRQMMGWAAIKDEYAKLVAASFTEDELRAALKFMRTPAGKSMAAKTPAFAGKLTAVMLQNAKAAGANAAQSAPRQADDGQASVTDVAISEVEKHDQGGRVFFTGMLTNNGKESRSGLQVEVNLFLRGKFVDQYSTYVSGAIRPGQSRYFKITCGCKDNPPAEHDSYKFEVLGGY